MPIKLYEKYVFILQRVSVFENELTKITHDITRFKSDHKNQLEALSKQYNTSRKELTEELDKLKAEIDRYGRLLAHFYQEEEINEELKGRFEKLKTAVKEHVESGLLNHKSKYENERNELKKNFKVSYIQKTTSKNLRLEEQEDQIEKLTLEYSEYLENELYCKKGTARLKDLTNFSEPNFVDATDALLIGTKTNNFKFGKLEISLDLPYILNFIDQSNLAVIYDQDSADTAEAISDVLIFRLLFSHLPDKIKIHLFDRNMNQKFKEFLPISNAIISKNFEWEQFKDHLTQTEQLIRSKLSLVWSDVEADHNSLYEYNLKMIQNDRYDDVIPYTLFVVDDLQDFINQHDNLDDIIQRLQNLTNNGCNALFLIKNDGNTEKLQRILASLNKGNFNIVDLCKESQQLVYENHSISEFEIQNLPLDSKKLLVNNFNFSLNNIEATRSKLKFKAYALTDSTQWFSDSPAAEVTVPIGKSMSKDGFEYLSFKTKDMLSNAMLCGGVGSGKTNFLKSFITSLSLKYSPEELELWLVDMKNGAGFSIFHNCELPHATKFAFSAESELINDLFFQLRKEMEKRYADFATHNIDNLADAYASNQFDRSILPKRIVLIIDEFATIFSEDAPYLDEISSNLLSIIQKGRAMGINILLAAQNFNNIRNASFNQAVTLIPTRILLKSSPEAASSILGHSNNGSVEITRIGEGLINNNYGEINNDGGNYFFKSFLLDNEDLEPIIQSIKKTVVSRNISIPSVKFIDAKSPANFQTNAQLFKQFDSPTYQESYAKKGISCYLGESYLMELNSHFSFQWKVNARHAGQNIIISGNDREYSTNSIFSIISSITYGIPSSEFTLLFFNAHDEDYTQELSLDNLNTLLKNYDAGFYQANAIEKLIITLEVELEKRRNNSERKPIIAFIIGLEKFIDLHKSSYNESELSERFKKILSTASNYGIYFVVEINKPTKLDLISRDLLSFFEHRICYFMNNDESHHIINSKAASQLISSEAPEIKNKAIYFSQSEGHAEKFKSYQNLALEEQLIFSLKKGINQKFSLLDREPQVKTEEELPADLASMSIDDFADDDISFE